MESLMKIVWFIAVISCVSAKYYHCRRYNQPCLNGGTCDKETGECKCDFSQFFGFNCAERIANVVVDQTQVLPCLHQGVTVNDGPSGNRCYCPEKYYGPLCETKRASLKCRGDSMVMDIVPFPNFNGLVMIKNNRSDMACAFNKSTNSDGMTVYTNDLSFESRCSVVKSLNSPQVGKTSYKVEVLVQMSPLFVTSDDLILDLECIHRDASVSSVTGGVGEVDVNEKKDVPVDQAATNYNPVIFAVQKADGKPLPASLALGTPLRLYFALSDSKKYTSIYLESCAAVSGDNVFRENIVLNGCPTDVGRSLIIDNIIYDTKVPAVIVYFNAFRFSNSPIVSFDCGIRVCLPSENNCIPPVCTARRKRRASGNATSLIDLRGTMRVNEEGATPMRSTVSSIIEEHKPRDEVQKETCPRSFEYMSIFIVLGVAILLLLVAVLCLSVKFMRTRIQGKYIDPTLLQSPQIQ